MQSDEDIEMTHGTQQEDANALQEKGPRDTVELCITGTEAPDFPEGQASLSVTDSRAGLERKK